MTETERELTKRWVDTWAKAAPELQKVRDADIRAADTASMIETCAALFCEKLPAQAHFRPFGAAALVYEASPRMKDLVAQALELQTLLTAQGWQFCFIGVSPFSVGASPG